MTDKSKDDQSNISVKIGQLELKKNTLLRDNDLLSAKIVELERQNQILEEKLQKKTKSSKELEQEEVLLRRLTESKEEKDMQLEESLGKLEEEISKSKHKSLESEQEKFILKKILTSEKSKKDALQKKHYTSVAIAAIILSVIITGFFYYESVKNSETEHGLTLSLKTKEPLIQNLKGDVLNTWMAWHKAPGTTLYVSFVNAKEFPRDKVNVVKNAILSDESVKLDDSILGKGPVGSSSFYYKGWIGGLDKASQIATKSYIPKKIDVLEDSQVGDIEIELTNNKDPDGYAGFTKAIINNNRMLKAHIALYGVSSLSDDRLAAVARHEFGHALGLAHTTATEDLMAPVITTPYPYISDCTIDAIRELYNDKPKSEVLCEK